MPDAILLARPGFLDLVLSTPGLLAGWWLNALAGTTALDVVRNGNPATYIGGYTLGAAGYRQEPTVKLNGTSGDITIQNAAGLNLANAAWTIEAFAQRTATGVEHALFSQNIGAPYLNWSSADQVQLTRSNQANLVSSTVAHTDTLWHHVICTYAGSNGAVTFYVDGVQEGSSSPASSFVNSSGVYSIGTDQTNAKWFPGSIHGVFFYNVALNAAQARAHASAALGD